MTDLLFSLTIGPLQLIYEILYNGLVSITHNYGWALILLSFVTTLITVPLGKAVSNHIRKERLIESILDPQIKKIKATSTGAEQSKRIRNLYQRYSYNPLYSIRLAFGVLIQLPFLIGAYWMIAEHPSLSGISFGPIADLSQPDELLGGINVLPLIMTAANLGVVAISALMPKRDRIQAIVIAILFLVLLYSAPSALLVYWTTNNILLFVRAVSKKGSFITKWIIFKNQISSGWLWGFSVYICAVLASFATTPYFDFSVNRVHTIIACTDIIFITLILALLISNTTFNTKVNSFKSSICLCIALFLTIRTLGFWILSLDRYKLTTQFILLIPLMVLLLKIKHYKNLLLPLKLGNNWLKNQPEHLFWPASFLLSLLIGIYLPLQIYSSDPLSFDCNPSEIIEQLLVNYEAGIVISVLFWLGIKKFKFCLKITTFILSIFTVLAFLYTFIISPDYGVLTSFVLSKPDNLYLKTNKYWDAVAIISSITFVITILLLNRARLLSWVFLSFSVFLVFSSGHSILNVTAQSSLEQSPINKTSIPQNIQSFLTFSENHKNIIVIMLDMFTGGNVKEIFIQHPDLRREFNGFTWYVDSMSSGSSTIFGKPGILGGEQTTPVNLNKDANHSLEEKINFGWAKFINILQKENYDISIHDHTWLKPDLMQQKLLERANLINSMLLWKGFSSQWAQKRHLIVNSSLSPIKTLYAIATFRASPLVLKKKIYSDGEWVKTVNNSQNTLKWALDNLSQLDSLSTASISKVTDKNTFKFLINELTHAPWSLDSQCIPSTKGFWSSENLRLADGTQAAHIQAQYCALKSISSFINWLKANKIFDNTMIVLVSDHGKGDSSQIYQLRNKPYPIFLHSLLMVKPFNHNGELTINTNSLTANWDVPLMITNELKLTNLHPWNNKNRVREHVDGEWQRARHQQNMYNFDHHYKIRGTIFNLNNWELQQK